MAPAADTIVTQEPAGSACPCTRRSAPTRAAGIVGPSLADYLIPTHADTPDFDIVMVEETDEHLPGGIKGVGMLGHVGSSAAIADALAAATGRRLRRLPIRVEDVLGAF